MQNLKMDCFQLKGQSGIPIDLTFEQTINADAACQRAGISAMTNSISNRQRWAKSYYIRTTVISHLFESPAIAKKEDVTKELKPQSIKKNSEVVEKILYLIEDNMNPFNPLNAASVLIQKPVN